MKMFTNSLLSFAFAFPVLASADSWHRGHCSAEELEQGYKNVGRWVGNPHAGKDYVIYCVKTDDEVDSAIAGRSALVIHPKTGEALGTIEQFLDTARFQQNSKDRCSGRNCEWIGFCYCGGAGGRR